jgi:hypothetical protein
MAVSCPVGENRACGERTDEGCGEGEGSKHGSSNHCFTDTTNVHPSSDTPDVVPTPSV